MAEILDRIHAEIRARLAAGRAAAQEYERLEAALAALGGPAKPAPAARRRPAQPRAPRGANRAAVLRALEERPGASASELATASGVARPALYPLLNRLAERGEVIKEQLPGGATGFRLVREEPTAFPRPEAALPSEPAAADEPPAGDALSETADADRPPLAEAA